MNNELKGQITSFIFALSCVALFLFFPSDAYRFEVLVSVLLFLFVLPVLYTRIVLHKDMATLGFRSFVIARKDIFILISTVIVGGLIGFVMIAMNWGVEAYIAILPDAVLYNFAGFMIYELVFVCALLFLFTCITWGFVFNCTWHDHLVAYISTSILFIVLLFSFFQNIVIIIPLLVPMVIFYKKRFEYNIMYVFMAFFLINLIVDTMVVKSLVQ